MRWRRKISLFVLMLVASFAAAVLSTSLMSPKATLATEALLQPAPTQPTDHYDYFGELLTSQQAEQLVRKQGLDPSAPGSFERVGAVHITQQLLDAGENIFFNRKIGDTYGLQRVFGLGTGLASIQSEINAAISQLHGQPTSNLRITLEKDLKLGSRTFPKGSEIDTGFDIERGANLPLGLTADGNFTCATCHAVLDKTGQRLKGVPNGDLGISLIIALAPNTAAGFARLNIDPLDPKYQGNGKTIIDSQNNLVKLPDPQKFETAFDDAVLNVPFGNFESSPDGINNTIQIPNLFTFKTDPYSFSGESAVGPFGGLATFTNSVHSSEINLLAGFQLSEPTIGLDPEVYLGVVLQNAVDPSIRLPNGGAVKPSEWLRQVAPDPYLAENEDQIPAPGAGDYPNLQPSLLTFNGLLFSPNTFTQDDPASGPFFFADNALAAFQNSLVPPANRNRQNLQALRSGSVQRGAQVFEQANCATCHIPPFFTDNKIHPISEIGTNQAQRLYLMVCFQTVDTELRRYAVCILVRHICMMVE